MAWYRDENERRLEPPPRKGLKKDMRIVHNGMAFIADVYQPPSGGCREISNLRKVEPPAPKPEVARSTDPNVLAANYHNLNSAEAEIVAQALAALNEREEQERPKTERRLWV